MLLPVAEAQARVLALAPPVPAETIPLVDAAGRWLAEDVAARRSQPFADLSAMDGYAIRHADLPGPFALIGESAAGRPFPGTLSSAETVRIFTGAAMPAGADCVLIQEEAARDGDQVTLTGEGPAHPGRNVRRQGLDFTTGTRVAAAGDRLTPARLALLAAAGHSRVPVRRRIRVALAATGDELVAPGTADLDALPESNRMMIACQLAGLPVDIVDLGILPDRLDTLTAAFAALDADLLLTTGGASVGDHDLVRPALAAAGATIDFWRIALRPGKPMMAGTLGDAALLGLPGNPVSAFVTTELFAKPLIAHLAGAPDPRPRHHRATLAAPLPANDHREDYLRARWRDDTVDPVSSQDSGVLSALAAADCLIVRPPHAPSARIGDTVPVIPLA